MEPSITVDSDGIVSVLAVLRDPRNLQLIANEAAENYNDAVHDFIDAGRGFAVSGRSAAERSEGSLQDQTNWMPLSNGAALVYSNASYAEFVEKGTGEFVGHRRWVIGPIAPNKALTIPVNTGEGFILRRKVVHKGSRPHPFFFADLEARKDGMVAAGLSVLSRRIING